jgi:hypothetical protein
MRSFNRIIMCFLFGAVLLCCGNSEKSKDARAADSLSGDGEHAKDGLLTDVKVEQGLNPAACKEKDNFTLCSTQTNPDYWYDICIDEQCVSPGSCGDKSCNAVGPHYKLPPDSAHQELERSEPKKDEPVVMDKVTGLMWQGCAAGTRGLNCSQGTAQQMAWSKALEYCNTLKWGDKEKWYLPDEYEIHTIVDYGQDAPAINKTAFPNTPVDWFWTSSTSADKPEEAWYLSASEGALITAVKQTSLCVVRCVRRTP